MATTDIFLDLDQLNTEVIAVNSQKLRDIEKAMRSAFTAVSALTLMGWEGDSKDCFVQEFANYKKEIQAFTVALKDFTTKLKTIHGNAKRLNSQSSKISAKM